MKCATYQLLLIWVCCLPGLHGGPNEDPITTVKIPSPSVHTTAATEPPGPAVPTTTLPTTTVTTNSTIPANITTTTPANITTTTTSSSTTTTTTTSAPPTTITTPSTVPSTSEVPKSPSTVGPLHPTSEPTKDRRFDGPSFIGGIVLSLGIMAIAFVSWKFYKARSERNYHTL